jgi:hypothetical protein
MPATAAEPAPDSLRLRSVRQVAAIYNCHPITIRRWYYARLISAWKVGGMVLVDLDEINARMVRQVYPANGKKAAK